MSEFWQGVWTGILGWWFLTWLIKQLIVNAVVNHIKEQQENEEVLLKLEKVGDMIYCYRKDTDEFIGQATSLQEIANIYKRRFPNNTARIAKEDSAGVL